MTSLMFLAILLAALFALNYVTKRRFGVLGLALAAGSLLSTTWTDILTPVIAQQGINTVVPPLSTLVAASLILLPPCLLLFSGPSYKKPSLRIVGSLAFAVLACAFLLVPLGGALQMDGNGLAIYQFLNTNKNIIIVAGLVLAIVDVLLTRKAGGK